MRKGEWTKVTHKVGILWGVIAIIRHHMYVFLYPSIVVKFVVSPLV